MKCAIGLLVALLALATLSVQVNAQLPAFCDTPGGIDMVELCTNYTETYAAPAKFCNYEANTGATFESDLAAGFVQLDTLALCQSCSENLKKFLCRLSFPEPKTKLITVPIFGQVSHEVPIFPTEYSCENVLTSCIPSDAPPEVQALFRASFGTFFSQISPGATDCAGLYIPIEAMIGATYYPYAEPHIFENMTDIAPQAGCTCRYPTPGELPFCNPDGDGPVSYPVWTALLVNKASIEATAQSVYTSSTSQLDTVPGLACPRCLNQTRNLFCAQFFPSCSGEVDPTALFLTPCKNVCTQFLETCRLNQIDDTVKGLLEAGGETVDLTPLNQLTATCENTTLFNPNTPCGTPSLGNTTKCACKTFDAPTVLRSECKNYVNWTISPALTDELITTLDDQIYEQLKQFTPFKSYVCNDCWDGLMNYICASAFPECGDDAIVKVPCPGECSAAVSKCRMPILNQVCDLFPSLPANNATCKTLPARTPCACVSAVDVSAMVASSKCAGFINYDTFPGVTPSYVSVINANLTSQLNQYTKFLDLLQNCTGCQTAITRVACQLAFPQCDPADPVDSIIPMNSSNCEEHISNCGVPALGKVCGANFPNPFASVTSSPKRFRTEPITGGTCVVCSPPPKTLKNCGKYADWDTIKLSIGVLKPDELDGQIGAFFTSIKLNCTICADQIKRTLCSIFILPCSPTTMNNLVESLLSLNVTDPSALNVAQLIPLMSRPCKSKCIEVFDKCMSTAPPGVNLLVSCNTRFPDFPAELFSNLTNCYTHDYPTLPPPTCPVIRKPPAAPVPLSGQTDAPAAPIDAGAVAGGILGGLIVAAMVGVGVTILILWRMKKWIFRIPLSSTGQAYTDFEPLPPEPTKQDWSNRKKASPGTELKNVKK